jgi:hypothetical protein
MMTNLTAGRQYFKKCRGRHAGPTDAGKCPRGNEKGGSDKSKTALNIAVVLLNSLHLPLSESGKRRAAAHAEWYSVMNQPLAVHDVIG